MTARTLPPGLPPLTMRALADLLYSERRACEEHREVFFGPDADEDEAPGEHAARVAVAREICASCPVRRACLAYALRTRQEFGVWAGLDADAGELAYLTAAARRPVTTTPARPTTGEAAA